MAEGSSPNNKAIPWIAASKSSDQKQNGYQTIFCQNSPLCKTMSRRCRNRRKSKLELNVLLNLHLDTTKIYKYGIFRSANLCTRSNTTVEFVTC